MRENLCACVCVCVVPRVDPVGGSGPPEQFAQVLSDTLPQDVAGALALFAAAHHKLVQVGRAAVHRLHGDDGCRAVAGGVRERLSLLKEERLIFRLKTFDL